MIKFQANDGYEIDLTAYGLTFNEFSDYFTKLSQKNYTFPINLKLDAALSAKLGLVNYDNISNYNTKVEGYLIVESVFYDTYMTINGVVGDTVELSFFYGDDILDVFDKTLRQLSWPIIDVGISLDVYATLQLSKSWPTATHNFPKVYRPQLRENENYNAFKGFVNNRVGSLFFKNSLSSVDGEPTPFNNNVIAPYPYLLEVLKMAFESEGKAIRGDFVDDVLIQKILYIPNTFLEYYSDPTQRSYWRFAYQTSQEFIDGRTLNKYERTLAVSANGTYNLDVKLNFPLGKTSFFQLDITYGSTSVYSAKVKNGSVEIDQRFSINVADDAFSDIKIIMQTSAIQSAISELNSFVFDYEEGRLNAFPEQYSIGDIMPDIKFRTFYNAIKEFFNLDVTTVKNAVYINYMDKSLQTMAFDDHSDFEVPLPNRKLNGNNLFKLSLPDGEEILASNTGQVYSDDGFTESETTTIPLSVLPVKVASYEGLITGKFPEVEAEIVLALYDGQQEGEPVLVESINERTLSLQSIYDNFHKFFLSFRANAEQYKESYLIPITKHVNIKRGVYKYNKRHLITSLRKRRHGYGFWKVDQESETF